MTVGIICLDGLDHRLASEHGLFEPTEATGQPLVNDLHGDNRLFTPRVWNSIFLGEDQDTITDWIPEPRWETATEGWNFIWDKVVGTSVLNLNLHTNYLHQNACIPNGWTPSHGSWGMMKRSTEELIGHWNETLDVIQPPLQIAYWRLPDAFGHWAAKQGAAEQETLYRWMREEFWKQIDLPDQWLVMSDHGFHADPASLDSSITGKDQHSEHGCAAATFELDRMRMSEFIPAWHDIVIWLVREGNLEALGYR